MQLFAKLEIMTRRIGQGCLFNVISYHSSSVEDPEASTLEKTERQYFALADIAKGESLKLPIIQVGDITGTLERRNILQQTTGIQCSCRLCKDPTELDTYFSALKCTEIQLCKPDGNKLEKLGQSNLGYLLPVDPLNQKSTWKCNNCSATKSFDYVQVSVRKLTLAYNSLCQQLIESTSSLIATICKANSHIISKKGNLSTSDIAETEKLLNEVVVQILPAFERCLKKELNTFHWNFYLLARARMVYLEVLHFFLCLNRSEEFVPADVLWLQEYGFKMLPRFKFFATIPANWVQLNEELRDKAAELLEVYQKAFPVRSLLPGRLYYYLAFSKWMILKTKTVHHRDYDMFKLDLDEWSDCKKKADNCFRSSVQLKDNQGFAANIVETLEKMDSVDPTKNEDTVSIFQNILN